MSWYVIDCAAASRIINTLHAITTRMHVDFSYLNNFNWQLKEHELQRIQQWAFNFSCCSSHKESYDSV